MADVTIFDIQRCSLVDGPGIRTTVFFKGCNLRCKWCHNPESQLMQKQVIFHKKKCTGCGKCKQVCPNSLETCDLCGKCADYCPNDARELCGRTISVTEIFKEIEKDRSYYDMSNGGVTFSGGECMLQIDALEELIRLCHGKGINTAVDTAGDIPWDSFEKVIPYADWFLYDVKCWDENTHIENTGVSNSRILENLRRLAAIDSNKIIIRIPVIPSVNTSNAEMRNISDYIKNLKISKVELLPYHKMGEHKYEDLGRDYQLFNVPSETEMKGYRAFFDFK